MIYILFFIFGYLIATLWENILHNKILHTKKNTIHFWKRNKHIWLFKQLYYGYYTHHVIHHQRTFKNNYTEQFINDREKDSLNEDLLKRFGKTEEKRDYGLTIGTYKEYIMFNIPLIFFVFLIYYFTNNFVYIFIFIIPSILATIFSKFIHPYLHKNFTNNKSFLTHNKYFKLIYINHYIHHQDDTKNFNLLPGGDYILNTYLEPSDNDVKIVNSFFK